MNGFDVEVRGSIVALVQNISELGSRTVTDTVALRKSRRIIYFCNRVILRLKSSRKHFASKKTSLKQRNSKQIPQSRSQHTVLRFT